MPEQEDDAAAPFFAYSIIIKTRNLLRHATCCNIVKGDIDY